MDTLITLTADGFKVKVSRQLMVEKSEYFSAALTSGMLEATSGQFFFSKMSGDQLSLLADCAKLSFSTWPSSTGAANTPGTEEQTSPAPKNNLFGDGLSMQLKSVVGLAAVADYLRINCLTELCLNRLADLIDQLWVHCKADMRKSIGTRDTNDGHSSSTIDAIRSLLTHCLDVSQLSDNRCFDLLLEHILQHPGDILSRPRGNQDTPVSFTPIHLVTFILSSNRLCVPDEESVLNTMLSWLTSLINSSIDLSDCSNTCEAFIDSVRLGLLSPEARQRFFNFWSTHFPSIRWFGAFTVDSMVQLFGNSPYGGTFASVQVDVTTEYMTMYRPRASVPCLLSLLPTASGDNLEILIFNLLSGSHFTFTASPDLFALLSGCNPNTDFTRRIFLCHSNIASTVIILCHDVINGCLSGFLWSLANFEAQWLPSLAVPVIRTGYSTATNTTSTSLYGNPLGIASLSTGLYVYCTTTCGGYVRLHVFRLDLKANAWQEFAPTSLAVVPTDGLVLFTPVEHMSCLATRDWLYASIEITYRSKGRDARIRRHNLHHTSQLRSIFLCFTPVSEERKLRVQMLPPAPFLVRIYRLLTVRSSESIGEFLFAFGTCTRDQSASQVCFDVASRQWIQWSPVVRSSDSPVSHRTGDRPSQLFASLDPELLGFRGLACVTNLQLARESKALDSGTAESSDFRVFGQPADQLVLIGRPDYRFDYDRRKEVTSGIWFHQPHVFLSSPDEACSGDPPREPQLAFPLPTSLLQRLYDLSSPALVALVNWDYAVTLVDSGRPFVFRSEAPNLVPFLSDNEEKSADCGTAFPSPITTSLLSCMNYSFGYSACDSD